MSLAPPPIGAVPVTRHLPARLITSFPLSGRFMRIGVDRAPSLTVPVTLKPTVEAWRSRARRAST